MSVFTTSSFCAGLGSWSIFRRAMHIASALGVPTVAIFGATDDTTTGPTGPLTRVIREHVECSPCLLRECPIDHRCMTRVTAEQVAAAALALREESVPAWTHETK